MFSLKHKVARYVWIRFYKKFINLSGHQKIKIKCLNVNAINSHILVCFHNNDRKRVFSNKIVKIFWPVMSAELCWPVKAGFVPVCKSVSQAASQPGSQSVSK